jgi:YD repeat-containing protein
VAVWRFAQNCIEATGKAIAALLLALSLLFLPPSMPAHADNAQYFYDPGGRLIGMIDTTVGSAQYNYDQAGNILSIARTPNANLGVVQFYPTRGPVGTSVTISGTGFVGGTTTVKFNNNITATPTSVTNNSITVPVPSGATTGAITISRTSPAGSITTAAFTVAAPAAAPTITSFTPTKQVQDSTIAVTGTNFDIANSKAYVNRQAAQITAATATSLTVKVPPASSGRVTVQTPVGSVTSTADLIVPPFGYTAATVLATGRTTLGAAPTALNVSPNNVSLLLFDVTAGQTITSYSVAPNSGCETVALVDPSGLPLFPPIYCSGYNWFGPIKLNQSGTYALQMTSTNYTGPITSTLYNVPAPVTGTVALNGTTTTLNIGTPGQQGILTFNNTTPNQKVSININFGGMGSCNNYSILNPDGTTYLVPATDTCANQFWQNSATLTLAQTGTYTMTIKPALPASGGPGAGVGSVQMTIFQVPADISGSIPLNGTTTSFTFTTPGQQGLFTFNNTVAANLKTTIYLDFSGMTCGSTYSIQAPNGSFLVPATVWGGNAFFQNAAPVILPQMGVYKISVVPLLCGPVNSGTGVFKTTIYQVPADVTGSIPLTGTTTPFTFTTPGQQGLFTFNNNVAANLKTTMYLDFGGMACGSTYSIQAPDGSFLVPSTVWPGNGFFQNGAIVVLAQTGVYKISEVPLLCSVVNAGTGVFKTTIFQVPADATGTLTIGGPQVNIVVGTPGQRAKYSFTGTSGQKVAVTFDNSAIPNCSTYSLVRRSTGTQLIAPTGNCTNNFSTAPVILPANDTYDVPIYPDIAGAITSPTGTYKATVAVVP